MKRRTLIWGEQKCGNFTFVDDVDDLVDENGVGLLTVTGIGIAAHAAISKFKNPKDGEE